ncbi:MAG: hypothetical protein WDN46_22485 [Methylocella sp.]
MNKMVERVARALCRKDGVDPDAPRYNMLDGAISGKQWEDYADDALAAIDAMSEPTDEMITAGYEALASVSYTSPNIVWRAMIDRARR